MLSARWWPRHRKMAGTDRCYSGAADESIFQSMKKNSDLRLEHTKIVPVIQKESLETTLQFGEDKQVRVVAGEDYSVIQSTDNASIISYQRRLTNVELPDQKEYTGRGARNSGGWFGCA